MNLELLKYFKGDRVIWIILLLLSVMSLLIVYSSTSALAYRQASGNTLHYLIRQFFFLGIGIGIMLLMVNVIPVKIYAILANYLLYFSIFLLLLTVALKFADIVKDSGRTLKLGPLSFQPAEIAKISLIIYAAKVLSVKQKTKEDLFAAFKRIMIFTTIVCGLIFMSNFSTAVLLYTIIIAMMFVGRVPLKYVMLAFTAGVMLVVAVYFTADYLPESFGRVHTAKARIERYVHSLFHRDNSSQTGITQADYAQLAIYEGGIVGKGPGHSDVSNYMAAAYNDFIFAITVEEYGLIIGTGLMFLYLILFFRGVVIVRRSTRTFPAFLVTGFVVLLVFQAMISIGVSSGALPVTGQPLPWISLGGTSLIFTSIAFGCILSVSHQNQKNREIQQQPVQVNVPDEDCEMEK